MTSAVYTVEDLEAMLRAITLAALVQPAYRTPHAAAFRRGFLAAVATVATACDIPAGAILPAGRHLPEDVQWPMT